MSLRQFIGTRPGRAGFPRALVLSLVTGSFMIGFGAPDVAQAQTFGGPPPFDLPSQRRPEETLPDSNVADPSIDVEIDAPTASLPMRFRLEALRVLGNSVLPDSQIREIGSRYVGEVMEGADIDRLREELTLAYTERGYVTSGVLLPDQDLKDGILALQVIEGRVTEIRLEGNERFQRGFLEPRLLPYPNEPVNIGDLSARLTRLQNRPDIQTVMASLRPGHRMGESILTVRIIERRALRLGAFSNNYRTPSIGPYVGGVHGTLLSPLGFGERIRARAEMSEGLRDFEVDLSTPVTRWDTLLDLRARYSTSEVVEEPFDRLNIHSRFLALGVGLSQPFFVTPDDTLVFGAQLEWRRVINTVLGQRLSLTEGADDGESIVVPLRLEAEWLRRQRNRVVAVHSVTSFGLDILDATDVSGAAEDGNFVSWILQLQWAERPAFWRASEIVTRTNLQLASSPLPPLERFSIGGHASVRGFRENQAVRDNGYSLSIEYRMPMWERPNGRPILQVAPFFEHGRSWNDKGRTSDNSEALSALGLAFIAIPIEGIRAELSIAQRLTKAVRPRDDKDAQDYGIHFGISADFD